MNTKDKGKCFKSIIEFVHSFLYLFYFFRKGCGYINVDPDLVAGNKDIPLESLQTVSVLAKCLGPFSSWRSKLNVAKESGYNMVHFTPIQV